MGASAQDASPYVVSIVWRVGPRDRRSAEFVRVPIEPTAADIDPQAVGAAG